ncbi:MAG: heavy-metal-associated domain-containing protein [Terriglobales bacterium]
MGYSKLRLKISGMSCAHCVHAVEGVLAATPGVQPGKVAVGRAELAYEPGEVTPAEIVRRIGEAGYTAEVE